MKFEELYKDIDMRVVEKLTPERHGWIQMPEPWQKKLQSSVSEKWNESPSSIVNYISCPMKWLLERYIIEDESQEVSHHALLGTIVHRVLEVFYSEPNGLRSKKRLLRIQELIWKELLNGTRTGIVQTSLLEEWQLYLVQQTTGQDMAPGFVAQDEDEVVATMKYEVSQRIENLYDIDPKPNNIDIVSNETWARTSRNGIKINGKIDRISRDIDSGLEVIQDYKTGRTPFGDPDINILENAFIPCGLYALMRSTISENMSESGIVQSVELLYLKESAIYEIEIGKEEIDLSEQLLEAVTREMKFTLESGDIKLCPAETSDQDAPCRFCPVSGLCPAFTEDKNDKFAEIYEEIPETFGFSIDSDEY